MLAVYLLSVSVLHCFNLSFRLEDLRQTNLATHEQAKQKASTKHQTKRQTTHTPHITMGKAGRFACILTPMILTVASLITVALLLAGGTKRSILPSFYYVRVRYSIFHYPYPVYDICGTISNIPRSYACSSTCATSTLPR